MTASPFAPWRHGVPRRSKETEPALQVQAVGDHSWVIRQSKTVTWEAPFLFLLKGSDRALLLDTGAVASAAKAPVRSTVDDLIGASTPLVVAHTHSHGDHVAGDPQFADRRDTVVVGRDVDDVRRFFGFSDWPDEVTAFDLGGRVLDIVGIPGHHATSIACFDPQTGWLLTGDTIYPGRLFVPDYPAFLSSLDRLVGFAADRPVSHVLGCHIETDIRTGRDYPIATTYQPDEPPLQMPVARIVEIRDAARSVADRPGVHHVAGVVIWNGMRRRDVARGSARALLHRLSPRRP
jgi:glyoxylase-like metal-dependent hydrolase (beta-lactamase superfamily II)